MTTAVKVASDAMIRTKRRISFSRSVSPALGLAESLLIRPKTVLSLDNGGENQRESSVCHHSCKASTDKSKDVPSLNDNTLTRAIDY